MNVYRRFLVCYLVITAGALCLIASINFVVDPGGIYLKKIPNEKYLNAYTDKLVSAKTAIRSFENDRMVKMSLAGKISGYDCVILGSSHAMTLGVIASPSSLKAICPTAMNLGVSGGSFEDILIFSNRILHSLSSAQGLSGKTIVIEISPWLFKWEMDSRYGIFGDDLSMIKKELHMRDSMRAESYLIKLLKNLVNLDYLEKSIELIKMTRTYNPFWAIIPQSQELSSYKPVNNVNYDTGLEYSVNLPDGSLIYDSNYIKSAKTSKTYIADGDYKLSGNYYDEEVISIFKELLGEYRQRGCRIIFVLTPYHHTVFRASNEKNWKYLRIVEARVRALAKETGIPVYGSYDPANIGCDPDEFFDFMHPKRSCLAKIPFPAD